MLGTRYQCVIPNQFGISVSSWMTEYRIGTGYSVRHTARYMTVKRGDDENACSLLVTYN